jgi:hypothetical protein
MQGPIDGATQFLTPTGQPTPHEQRRERFQFTFIGPYKLGPGRFNDEREQVYFRGAGRSTYFTHGDAQLGAAIPTDPNALLSGAMAIFDRNINANSSFGFDLAAIPSSLDARGRPTQFTLSTDPNISAGIFVESYSQGTVDIHYIPSGRHTPGVFEQGTAIVRVRGTAYTLGVANLLRNTDINP